MKVSKEQLNERLTSLKAACRRSGTKLTHQRMEVFKEVARTNDHPDTEKVFDGVRKRLPMISLDTVYRTLWWLKDLGLISTLGRTHHRSRFDANLDVHHHFVCKNCGLTRDFISEELDRLELPGHILSIGHAEKTQVEVKGTCHKCVKSKEHAQNNKHRR